jgi:hypothetical protein
MIIHKQWPLVKAVLAIHGELACAFQNSPIVAVDGCASAEKCDAPSSHPCTTNGRNKHKGGAVKCPNSTSTCIGHRENLQNILFRVVKHHETSQMGNPLDGTFISLPTPIKNSPTKFQTSMLLHLLHALACVWQGSLFKLHQ